MLACAALVVGAGLTAAGADAAAGAAPHQRTTGAHASIIGGFSPDPAWWPWMAYLTVRGKYHCGGAVVAPTRVLTAGHCVDEGLASADLKVVVGRRDQRESSVGQVASVSRIRIDPQYTPTPHLNFDVAVLTLEQPVSVTPATLGQSSDWGYEIGVMGWGDTNGVSQELPPDLRAVNLELWGDASCDEALGSNYDPTTQLCAGGDGTHATCSGDSGGPAMVTGDGGATWRLIGVVSYHLIKYGCKSTGHPNAFAWAAGPTLSPWIAAAVAEPPPPAPAPPPPPAPTVTQSISAYVTCGRSTRPARSHKCGRRARIGAYLLATVSTTYKLCVRKPNGKTGCVRNQQAGGGVLVVNPVTAHEPGPYVVTWLVEGKRIVRKIQRGF